MKQNKKWSKLDNAAKIFPPTTGKRDVKVFRFSCELYENVEEKHLQSALEKSLEKFPHFRVVLKHGLFWYYLEETNIVPKVKIESKKPCSPIYDRNIKKLLFEVTYYKKRINFEIYHALADGTGAIQFFKVLVINYLNIKENDKFKNILADIDYDASDYQKEADSFQKYYDKKSKKNSKLKFAYQLKGDKIPKDQMKLIEGVMPVKDVLENARKYKATITAFISSIIAKAIYEEMKIKDRKRIIDIVLPVNLRKYFESASARNFFSVINVPYDFSKELPGLKDIISYTNDYLKKELKPENLTKRMSALVAVEQNYLIRLIPLVIKDIVLKTAFKLTNLGETMSFSNVGLITIPEKLEKHIKLFDMTVSTDKMQACMCSYNENLVLTFSSIFENTDIPKRVFRMLAEHGINVTIVTNQTD